MIAAIERCRPYPDFIQLTNLKRLFMEGKAFPEEINDGRLVGVIFGHHVHERIFASFPDRKFFLFTCIRDPRKQLASHYAFQCRLRKACGNAPVSFAEFYASRPGNFICTELVDRFPTLAGTDGDILARAKNVLQCFDCIAATEDLQEKLPLLERKLGFSMKSGGGRKNPTSVEEYRAISAGMPETDEDMWADRELFEMYMRDRQKQNPYGKRLERSSELLAHLSQQEENRLKNLQEMYRQMAFELNSYGVTKAMQELFVLRSRVRADSVEAVLSGSGDGTGTGGDRNRPAGNIWKPGLSVLKRFLRSLARFSVPPGLTKMPPSGPWASPGGLDAVKDRSGRCRKE